MNRAQKLVALAMILLTVTLIYESARRQEIEMRYGFALRALEESDHRFYRCESIKEQCCQ